MYLLKCTGKEAGRNAELPFFVLAYREKMAKEYAKTFYASRRWQQCRKSYIDNRIMIDGGLCEECHKNLGSIVHHKTAITESNVTNPDITLSFGNLEYVCKECHDLFEGHGLGNDKVKPLFAFDEEGQPVSMREIDRGGKK